MRFLFACCVSLLIVFLLFFAFRFSSFCLLWCSYFSSCFFYSVLFCPNLFLFFSLLILMLVARTRVFIHVSKLHELPNAWNYAVNNSAGSFQYTPIFSLCHCAQHTMSEVLLITVVFYICCSMLASFGSKHAHDSFLSSSLAWALAAARGSFVSYVGLCCVFCCIP